MVCLNSNLTHLGLLLFCCNLSEEKQKTDILNHSEITVKNDNNNNNIRLLVGFTAT